MSTGLFDWALLTDEERAIRDLALEVAAKEIAPRATQHDIDGTYVRDSIDALAEAGLLGVSIPREYGGLGGSQLSTVMALDAVSAACGSTGAAYTFHLLLVHMIVGGGPEALRQKYLPDMAKRKLGAMAFNEGVLYFGDEFDATTEDRGDYLVLNADKPFVTSAGEADVYVFSCQQAGTDANVANPLFSQQYVLADKETSGIFAAELYNTMGLRGASNGRMKAENARIPKENIISGPQFSLLKTDAYKTAVAVGPQVVSMGLAGAAVDAALRRTREKGPEQWKNHMLAEMVSRLDALRSYHHIAARTFDDLEYKPIVEINLGMRRLGGEDALWICDKAIDIIGGPGVFLTSPVQRYYRDARVCAFLMLPLNARRERLADELYRLAALAENDEPRTMPWEPQAEFTYLRAYSSFLVTAPGPARQAFARSAVERYVQSRGEDRVTIDGFADYLVGIHQQVRGAVPVGAGGRPGGPPPGGFPPGGFPPGGGPPGGFPPGGFPPGGFPGGFPGGGPPGGFPGGFPPGGGPPGGFPPGGFPSGGFPPGGFPPGGGVPGTEPATGKSESEEESPEAE